MKQKWQFVKSLDDENLIIMGDWNAVVKEEYIKYVTGRYGLGKPKIKENRQQCFSSGGKEKYYVQTTYK